MRFLSYFVSVCVYSFTCDELYYYGQSDEFREKQNSVTNRNIFVRQ